MNRRLILRRLGLVALVAVLAVPVTSAMAKKRYPLSPEQRQTLRQISDHYNGIRSMGGRFIQTGHSGRSIGGMFKILRPGRMLLKYDKPSRVEIRANGRHGVIVWDRRLNTKDLYPLSKTPLRFLLADKIDMERSGTITGYSEDDARVSVTIFEETPFGSGTLTLVFDKGSRTLQQWSVRDSKGHHTVVAITSLKTGIKVNKMDYWFDTRASANRDK